MATQFAHEIAATEQIRKANPEIGAYVLARRIKDKKIATGAQTGVVLEAVPFYTTLARIRRFDARLAVQHPGA